MKHCDICNRIPPRTGIEIATLVKYLLMDAVAAKASDIHIEPWESTLAVRLRLNGVLTELGAFAAGI